MKCAIDNTFLTLLMRPQSAVPESELGSYSQSDVPQLLSSLKADWNERRARVIIPTPVLAEVLVAAESGMEVLNDISAFSQFDILPFCERCALELAIATRQALKDGDKRGGVKDVWQKVKLDMQIVAIAKANGATTLYTTDNAQAAFAKQMGIRHVKSLGDLVLPSQTEMDL